MNIYRSFISAATPFIAIRRRALPPPLSDRGRRRTAIVPRISCASHTLLYRKYRDAPCTGTARVTPDRPWIVWNSRVDGIVVCSWDDITLESPWVVGFSWNLCSLGSSLTFWKFFLIFWISWNFWFEVVNDFLRILIFLIFFQESLFQTMNDFLKDL